LENVPVWLKLVKRLTSRKLGNYPLFTFEILNIVFVHAAIQFRFGIKGLHLEANENASGTRSRAVFRTAMLGTFPRLAFCCHLTVEPITSKPVHNIIIPSNVAPTMAVLSGPYTTSVLGRLFLEGVEDGGHPERWGNSCNMSCGGVHSGCLFPVQLGRFGLKDTHFQRKVISPPTDRPCPCPSSWVLHHSATCA